MAGESFVEIYIRNYSMNGTVVTSETLLQTVPFSGDPVINNPRVKNEIGKAGSFEFEMETPSPYYDAMLQMKTIMRVVYFGHTIFRGRVLTIDKKMARTRIVHCEGDFAFLLDSHQLATKEEVRPKITVLQYLQQIIEQHNSDVSNEPIKQFVLGEVPGQYTSATNSTQRVKIPEEKAEQKFGDSSWNTSMDRIENLVSEFGGYFRTRYDAINDVTYLDWFDKFYNASINTQTVEVSKNLIDLSGPTEVENLFTVVIPIGKKGDKEIFISDYWPIVDASHEKVNYMMVPELATIPLYTNQELNSVFHRKEDYENAIDRFGYIWKVENFENADTPEKLFGYCKDWIKNNFMPEITQWDVSALDMRILDSENQVLLCGDRLNLVHPEVDQTYEGITAISADYDLYSPDKNKYSVGIPNQQINAPYGKAKNGKGGGGISDKPPGEDSAHDGLKDLEVVKKKFEQQYAYKTEHDGDILLDNALAFLMYDTEGNEREQKDVLKDTAEVANKLMWTSKTKMNELLHEAMRRGVSVNDPQLLIDFTPDVKRQQTKHKADTEWYLINTIGLTPQQAEVLLNETAGQSWLAALTNDDGEWTDYAYSQGAAIWRDGDKMKQQSIDTKSILNGDKTTERGIDIIGMVRDLTGINMNVGGGFLTTSIDDLLLQLGEDGSLLNAQIVDDAVTGVKTETASILNDLGLFNSEEDGGTGLATKIADFVGGLGIFSSEEKNKTSGSGTWWDQGVDFLSGLFKGNNTESGGKEVEVKSDTVDIDGTTNGGTMGIGTGGLNGWKITLNRPMSYTSGGQTFTVPAGAVASDDFHIKDKYDSLKAKLLVVDTLLADYAQIGTLVAMKAQIDNITGNTIHANTRVSAADGNFLRVTAGTHVSAPSFIYKPADMGGVNILSSIWAGYRFQEDNGSIKLQGRAINAGTAYTDLASFNIAATAKYIADVAAARTNGRSDVFVHNISISAGSSEVYDLKYLDSGGNEQNTGNTFTVTASGGGGDIPSSSIQIGTYGSVETGTPARSMKSAILQAIDHRSYFSFEVWVEGTHARKTYSLDFTT